ncbi:MAG TPA: coenzyme F420-0:L-glutamate ligase [Candidatus Atopostipes pullistercoris]|uniref:Coenzyme F420-0:L-glutamate ligase n=1 Tax=Candidatus Atopostipes pullistercoris TaxID=2838467 RepID=A0A9D2JWZ8_9LACT|nr:coenzyme F420-0:L-glutamate ligase [Candidatus Atopostipes pullistercoris]
MNRTVGTVVRGLRAPIIKEGDDIVEVVVETLLNSSKEAGYEINDRDIIALTESIVARAQGNYASIDDIATDVKNHFQDKTVGILFPILSRNRFMNLLKGFARGAEKVVIQLSFPADEVGNHLISLDQLDESGVNPWSDTLSEEEFAEIFGKTAHPFTGVDYIQLYKDIVAEENTPCEIIFSNNPKSILYHTDSVIACDIHSRKRTKRILQEAGANLVLDLGDLMNEKISENGGYNEEFGLLGANNATDESVKLFPSHSKEVVTAIQNRLQEETGKIVEAMVYGDGAFKDPVGEIWELADPVVSPGYTAGLEGTPNEVKLKYLADNDYADLSGEELQTAIRDSIGQKEEQAKDSNASLGTTPRQLTDLIGSLSDLTSGSGDKGTPFVYIQGYFDDYTK